MRPSELYHIKLSQVQHDTIDGVDVWKITGLIGDTDGASKTRRGGIKAISEKPVTAVMFNEHSNRFKSQHI